MARTVADAALLLSVMAGPDRRVPPSLEESGAAFAAVIPADLAGRRIAVSTDLGGAVEIQDDIGGIATNLLAGCWSRLACVEPASPDFGGADECFRTLRAWTFEATLGYFLDRHADLIWPSLYANHAPGAGHHRAAGGPRGGAAH